MADYVIKNPSSITAEAVRTLRTMISLRGKQQDKKPKIVMLTSSYPGEGKTTLSCWMARLAAKSGEKVLLIDADLRRPNVHKSFQDKPHRTLVDYLTGKSAMDEIITKDNITGLHIIYGSSTPSSALELVNSPKLQELLDNISAQYDLVIIDSPACLPVSDARVLATLSDLTIYTIAWNETPRDVVKSGLKQFSDLGQENIAFVLSNVDIKRHVQYGYGETVYYYAE